MKPLGKNIREIKKLRLRSLPALPLNEIGKFIDLPRGLVLGTKHQTNQVSYKSPKHDKSYCPRIDGEISSTKSGQSIGATLYEAQSRTCI